MLSTMNIMIKRKEAANMDQRNRQEIFNQPAERSTREETLQPMHAYVMSFFFPNFVPSPLTQSNSGRIEALKPLAVTQYYMAIVPETRDNCRLQDFEHTIQPPTTDLTPPPLTPLPPN